MQLGSSNFENYARNLSRIYWSDFLDEQQRLLQARLVAAQRAIVLERVRLLSEVTSAIAERKGILASD